MAYDYLRFESDHHVARLTFCRPERANAINLAFATELHTAAKECRDNPDIRAVVLAAEGRLFCAGGDLASFSEAGDRLPEALKALLDQVHAAIEVFAGMDAPVIAEVAGTAAGAGMSLVAATNLAYATVESKFTMSFTAVGLTPDSSSTWFLPRLVGWRRAEELMLTNRVLSAKEAADWGLINGCFDDAAALREGVDKIARRLAAGPTRAYGGVSRLLNASAGRLLHEQLGMEGESIVAISAGIDGREGARAFLEKRKPEFTGR
ncbi:MAG: enoyl-CoA hydratase/isomerase family protein [Panacagrimonas sp.]